MKERYYFIDALRGLSMISMVAFHFSYDVFMVYGVDPYWYNKPVVRLWQQSICWSFILISGFVLRFGKNPIKRGIVVSLAGLLISTVTVIFMPSEVIWWGILSFIGGAMILTGTALWKKNLIKNKGDISNNKFHSNTESNRIFPLVFISMVMFFITRNTSFGYLTFFDKHIDLPNILYKGVWGIPFGFPPAGFVSSDYFPLFPWYFLFLAGHFLSALKLPEGIDSFIKKTARMKVPFLSKIGKYALPVYLVHQPVCMGICFLIFQV